MGMQISSRTFFGVRSPSCAVGGTLGLIATNTIRQGDTRATGLRWIRQHDGTIYNATRRYRWPGEGAAVVVCVLHIAKNGAALPAILDGHPVELITAFLFDQGSDDDPHELRCNANVSSSERIRSPWVSRFDDADKKGIASPISVMHGLLTKDPRNSTRIKPYIGGKDLLNSPRHSSDRYIIDFGDMTLDQASGWPDLLKLVREKVKPSRDKDKVEANRKYWWRFVRTKSGSLYAAIDGFPRVLAMAQTTSTFAPTFVPNGSVYDQKLVIFALRSLASFSIMQSAAHEMWLRFFGSTFKDDPVYTPTDVFDTFPFPPGWTENAALTAVGAEYFNKRATILISQNEGLTSLYNRFHDRLDHLQITAELRDLQAKLDRTVFDSYGWRDISERRSFEAEFLEEVGTESIRFTWPQETHDEVLVRLLSLNAKRHGEESRGLIRSMLAEDRDAFAQESVLDNNANIASSTAEVGRA